MIGPSTHGRDNIALVYKGQGARYGDLIPVGRFDLADGVAVVLVLEDDGSYGAGYGLFSDFIWQKIFLHSHVRPIRHPF